jgi:hypothetical protein
MEHPAAKLPIPNHVRAVFDTSAVFFDLPRAATFEDLAGRLYRLGLDRGSPLTSIDIETEPSGTRQTIRSSVLRRLAEAGEMTSIGVLWHALMARDEPTKPYRGYVSAYLNRIPRTLAEAEKDAQKATTREPECAPGLRSDSDVERSVGRAR